MLQSRLKGGKEVVTIKSSPPKAKEGSTASKLTIQLVIPFNRDTRPFVEFSKQGPLNDVELGVFSAALKAANRVSGVEPVSTAQVSPSCGMCMLPCLAPVSMVTCPAFENTVQSKMCDAH